MTLHKVDVAFQLLAAASCPKLLALELHLRNASAKRCAVIRVAREPARRTRTLAMLAMSMRRTVWLAPGFLLGCSVYDAYEDVKRAQVASAATSAAPWTPESAETASAGASAMDAATPSSEPEEPAAADDDPAADLVAGPRAAPDDTTQMDASQSAAAVALNDEDAGAPDPDSTDAGATEPAAADAAVLDAAALDAAAEADGCSRDGLLRGANAYLDALAEGDARSLALHPKARYTENGKVETLGSGLWRNRPQTEFARHVLDAASCSTVTEAVLREAAGRVVYGVRLRYVDQQLLEVEAQVVRANDKYWAPEKIIVKDPDPFTEPLDAMQRSSAAELTRLATDYFDATLDASLLPPHADACTRRQNGALMPSQGSCGARPGSQRFEQRRYPVVDETAGIVTAIVKYDDFIGMYLFKVREGTVENIEVVGGASSTTTGW